MPKKSREKSSLTAKEQAHFKKLTQWSVEWHAILMRWKKQLDDTDLTHVKRAFPFDGDPGPTENNPPPPPQPWPPKG